MHDDLLQAKKLETLRTEVQHSGGVTLKADELGVFCPQTLTFKDQFECIAAIARAERWSFAFLRDGAVRFGSYA